MLHILLVSTGSVQEHTSYSGCPVFHVSCVSRTPLLPAKAMEKRLEVKFTISARFLSRYCLGKPVRDLRSLQLLCLCACLCALCSTAGDSSVLSATMSVFFMVFIPLACLKYSERRVKLFYIVAGLKNKQNPILNSR